MLVQVNDLKDKIAQIKQGGGEGANKRHTDQGKLLPRERINNLLDPGFLSWKFPNLRPGKSTKTMCPQQAW